MLRSQHNPLYTKRRMVTCGLLMLGFFFVYFILGDVIALVLHATVLPSRFNHIQEENSLRYEMFRIRERTRLLESTNWNRVSPMYDLYEYLHIDDSRARSIRERCMSLHQLDQVIILNEPIL